MGKLRGARQRILEIDRARQRRELLLAAIRNRTAEAQPIIDAVGDVRRQRGYQTAGLVGTQRLVFIDRLAQDQAEVARVGIQPRRGVIGDDMGRICGQPVESVDIRDR